MNVLVFDVGTSSMRGILFDRTGRQLLKKQVKYQPEHKTETWIEQKPMDFERALTEIAAGISAIAGQRNYSLDAVAITAQRSSVIPVDKHGTPLMPAIMWQDTRNAQLCQEMKKYDEVIIRYSGAPVNTVFSGGKMSWIRKERPEIYDRAHKLLNIPEYLIYLMTGEFKTDVTYASRSNLMNLRERHWDARILEIFGLDEEKLCPISEPASILGYVSAKFSRQTGILAGIPVISAGGDQQCAAVGQGAFQEGTLSITAGTGAFLVSACAKVPDRQEDGLICNCSSVRGEYMLEASVLTCCSAFDWYRSNFYESADSYEKINQDLQGLYNSKEESIVLPYFQGKSSQEWDGQAKALFANVSLATKRQNLLKALVEGIFLEIRNSIEIFRKYVEVSSATIGGGMTNSRVMNQMQADIYGMTLYRRENTESTALGALIVTLVTLGEYGTIADAFASVVRNKKSEVYSANDEKQKEYLDKLHSMNVLYQKVYGQGRGGSGDYE